MTEPTVAQRWPYLVDLAPGDYRWCACGRSRTQPFCDDSHRGTGIEPVPFTVLVNPRLTPIGKDMEEGWEGCLSVPGMRGLVPRHCQLRYQGWDARGTAIDRTVAGFHARVVQHECDHLAGILYPMRIRDLRNFGFTEELFPGEDARPD